MRYCDSLYHFRRRLTREVVVGNPDRGGVVIGGRHPVVVQSMITGVDGKRVSDMADLRALLRDKRVGDRVRLRILRASRVVDVPVELK